MGELADLWLSDVTELGTLVYDTSGTYILGYKLKMLETVTINTVRLSAFNSGPHKIHIWDVQTQQLLYTTNANGNKTPVKIDPIVLEINKYYAFTFNYTPDKQFYYYDVISNARAKFSNKVELIEGYKITGSDLFPTSGSTTYIYPGIEVGHLDLIPIIPAMTANNAPSPFVASADYSNTGNEPFKAFDHSTGTWMCKRYFTAGWLQIDLGVSKTAKRYTIQGSATLDANPKDWKLQGSNNGSTWVDLDTQTGVTGWTQVERLFDFTNNTAYRYYRLNITANNGNASWLEIAEMNLYEQYTTPPSNPARHAIFI